MSADDRADYSEYLRRRRRLRRLIYRFCIYPRIAGRLSGRVIDVGCGIGDFLAFRPGTVGVDVNPHNVDYCLQRGLDARVVGAGEYPFADASFDGAVMDNVLEHIADTVPTLTEIRRVLRRGGVLIVGVPGHRGHMHDPDHKHFYEENTLTACVEQGGLFKLRDFFYTPLCKSTWLSRHLRQYCIYGVFNGR